MTQLSTETARRAESVSPPRPERAGTIGLVLAESYPLLLDGMRHTFGSERGIQVLAACAHGEEALQAVRRHRADVLVMDLGISGNALQILKQLAGDRLPTRVVLVAGSLDEAVMLEAVRLGARGIVLKNMAGRLLVQCVRTVHGGGTWVEKVSTGRAAGGLLRHEAGDRDVAALLTPRERDIVRMATAGWPNKDIGHKLAIREGTVKAHLHHVYEKLGIKGRIELVLYVRDKGLFPPSSAATPRKSRP